MWEDCEAQEHMAQLTSMSFGWRAVRERSMRGATSD
jgi:hypothetical protein